MNMIAKKSAVIMALSKQLSTYCTRVVRSKLDLHSYVHLSTHSHKKIIHSLQVCTVPHVEYPGVIRSGAEVPDVQVVQ